MYTGSLSEVIFQEGAAKALKGALVGGAKGAINSIKSGSKMRIKDKDYHPVSHIIAGVFNGIRGGAKVGYRAAKAGWNDEDIDIPIEDAKKANEKALEKFDDFVVYKKKSTFI